MNMLHAQEPYTINIQKEDGLPSNEIYDAYQDQNGVMWLATSAGLVRFDGKNYKTFRNDNIQYTPGSAITPDNQGRMWYINFDGRLYFTNNDQLNTFYLQKVNNYLPFGITEQHLFYPQKSGLDVYDIKDLQFKKHIKLTSQTIFSTMHGEGSFYAISNEGIYKISDDLKVYHIKNDDAGTQNFSKGYYNNGYVFLLNEYELLNRIAIFDQDLNFQHYLNLPPQIKTTNCLFVNNKYYISTFKGLYIFDRSGKLIQVLYENKSIAKVLMDKQQNLWVFFSRTGIAIMPQNADLFYPYRDIDAKYIVNTAKGFFILDINGNIYEIENNNFHQFKLVYKSPVYAALDYYFYNEKNPSFLFSSMGSRIVKYPQFNTVLYNNAAVKDVQVLDEKYWIIAANGGFSLLPNPNNTKGNINSTWDYLYATGTKDDLTEMSKLFGLKLRARTVTYNENRQKIYGGSNIAFYSITPSNYQEITNNGYSFYAQKLITRKQNTFAISTQGYLYEVTEKDSLVNLSKQLEIDQYTILQIKLIEDKIILLTDKNLLYFNDDDYSISIIPIPCPPYEIRDFSIKGSQLYLLTSKGIIQKEIYTPIKKDAIKFSIHSIYINNQIVPKSAYHNIEIPKDFQKITIHYAFPDYSKLDKYTISYRLDMNNWNTLNADNTLELYALPEGKHTITFKVNDQIQTTILTINKPIPFYKSWWFLALLIYIIVSIFIIIYRWRIRVLNKKINALEEKVLLEKKLAASIVKAIKSQMNPHFFFNALNTIQAFIYTNDKETAGKYLNKFSKLTRKILEQTQQETITLQEEIDTLWLYLELENMRYDNEIHITIDVAKNIMPDHVRMPTMLLQPYIENAFKHGLLHKRNGQKLLNISFQLKQEKLWIAIEDNGIGRVKSEELQQNKKHKSFATEANEKRIELLNNHLTNQIRINIEDKYDAQGQALGTIVQLQLPLSY